MLLNIIPSRFIKHVPEFPFFTRLDNSPLFYVYTMFCLLIHLSVDTWVASSLLAVVNNAATKTCARTPLQDLVFSSFG